MITKLLIPTTHARRSNVEIQNVASDAIFIKQMDSKHAIRFVQRSCRVDEATAKQAVNDAAIWYKVTGRKS